MKKPYIFQTFFAYVFFTLASIARGDLSVILPKIDTYIEASLKQWGAPGMAVIIVKDGKVVHQKLYGTTTTDGKTPLSDDMLFPLASVTKNFTAHLVARLMDKGLLKWDDLVINHLPDFALSDPTITREITIRDLLSHRSGLKDFSADSLMELGWSADEIYANLNQLPMPNKFRESYDYQNVTVGLLGKIIERLTMKPLNQVYQEELFAPLKMEDTLVGSPYPQSHTLWDRVKAWVSNLFSEKKSPTPLPLHDHFNGITRRLPNGNPGLYVWPASSGLNASMRDLAKWLIFVLDKKQTLISADQITQTRTAQIDCGPPKGGTLFPKERVKSIHYGMGWFLHDYGDVNVLAHMGGMNGTRSLITIIPEENIGIIVVSHYGGMRVSSHPEAIRSKFLDLYLELDDVDWSTRLHEKMLKNWKSTDQQNLSMKLANPHPMKDIDYYVGEYKNDLYGHLKIEKRGKDLVMHYRDLHVVLLKHLTSNIFTFTPTDMSIRYGGVDGGIISFMDEGMTDKAAQVWGNIFHEGPDPLFKRVS